MTDGASIEGNRGANGSLVASTTNLLFAELLAPDECAMTWLHSRPAHKHFDTLTCAISPFISQPQLVADSTSPPDNSASRSSLNTHRTASCCRGGLCCCRKRSVSSR